MPREIILLEHQPRWVDEFATIADEIRRRVGSAAVRIDHIGSTAVAGLAAKDVIDVQLTVGDLCAAAEGVGALRGAGWRQGEQFIHDEFAGRAADDPQLRKLYMREPSGRRCHLHIRELGRFNQRFALLFRDYLRASTPARNAYEQCKRQAAALYPYDIDGYLALKAPVFQLIHAAADLWADAVDWRAGPSDR